MKVDRVMESCLYASDLDAAETFYTQVLGLSVTDRVRGRHVFLRCGNASVLIFNPAATETPQVLPPHGSRGPGHIAFAMTMQEVDAWRKQLREAGVKIELDIPFSGGETGHSLYFRDPAGNLVELITA